jgi:hypothetical protein
MAVVRRNAGWLSAAVLVLCAAVAGWWLLTPRPAPAMVQEGYTPLDAVAAGHIDALRRENGLDDDTLAALDATAAQLESVLAESRDWYDGNKTDLLTHWSGLADQRALIRRYQSEVAMGTDRASELASARQQLAQLEASYATFVAGLRQAAWVDLSDSQETLAEHMRARRDVPMPFRVLELSAAQDAGWQRARTRYLQRLAVTREAADRATIRAQYAQELETAIGSANLQNLASLRSYLGPASQRVVAAVQTVLPVESEG